MNLPLALLMVMYIMLQIERLEVARHDRKSFDCGQPSLNTFLSQYARQFGEKNVGVTWVAVDNAAPAKIIGYYNLNDGALIPDDLPLANNALPQVPIILLGRLAVDQTAQGRGIGRMLLLHALHHAHYFSTQIGVHAVVVDALNDSARDFYQQYGFQPLPNNPFRMYLSICDIAKLDW